MKFKKYLSALCASVVSVIALAPSSFAQITLSDDNGNPLWTENSQGDSTLTTNSNYFSQSQLNSYFPKGVAPAGFNDSNGGWIFSNGATILIADNSAAPNLVLGDPFVAFNYAVVPDSSGHFSVSFTSNFPSINYNPSMVKASFGVSLTDGTENGTGSTLFDASETATLSLTSGGTVSTRTSVLLPQLSVSDGGTKTESNQTTGFPGYLIGPSGSFNHLTVTISGDYSSGAYLGITGRVDVTGLSAAPEPKSIALALVASVLFVICLRRRSVL